MIIDGLRKSDRIIAAVLAFYAAFNRRDWDGMVATLAPEVVHDINQGPSETGTTMFRAFIERMSKCYREEIRDLVVMSSPDGKRASAEFKVAGEYVATDGLLPPAKGQKYVLAGAAFFELDKGKLSRVTSYSNLQEWVRQVGV